VDDLCDFGLAATFDGDFDLVHAGLSVGVPRL
jgi:hypothetical protein